ncbi:MAG TPA: hypothetical protein VK866_03075 [Acidimicrobiales bacterium]|nr:hypothetical protein [Acidimicrobiales bacterium]
MDHDDGLGGPQRVPWGRAWVALAVLAVLTGVLVALLSYPGGTLVLDDGRTVEIRCERPLTGAFGDGVSTWSVPGPAPRGDGVVVSWGIAETDCAASGRERLAISTVVALAGLTGVVVAVRRHRARRAATGR